MRCEHLHDSAVYVLGALSPPEREAYERHLADCAECRAEVAEFSDLPGLLGRLDPEIAAQIALASDPPEASRPRWAGPTAVPADLDDLVSDDPVAGAPFGRDPAALNGRDAPDRVGRDARDPTGRDLAALNGRDLAAGDRSAAGRWAGPTIAGAAGSEHVNGSPVDPLLPRVLDRARNARRVERRRRAWRTAGTALVAAFLGVIAVIGVRSIGIGQPDFEAMREVAATVPVQASLAVTSASDGTVVKMRCAYKDGEGDEYAKWTYKLVVIPKSGEPEEIDTWTARSGDELQLTAHSAIPRSNIDRIEIRKGDGTTLLTLST
jgi:hypothetical protein